MAYDFDRILDDNPIRDVLHRLGVRIKGSECKCPIHGDDRSVSGSIFRCKDTGREKMRCHGACDRSFDSIDIAKFAAGTDQMGPAIEWLGNGKTYTNGNGHVKRERAKTPPPVFAYFPPDKRDLLRPGVTTPPILYMGKTLKSFVPALVHHYRDAKGTRLIVLRYVKEDGAKSYKPVRWSDRDGFVSTSWQEGEERLFYNCTELAKHPDKTVLVVEGEKSVDLLRGLPAFTDEYVPITWAGGHATAKNQPWELLKGRRLLFWPDADLPKGDDVLGKSEIAMRKAAELAGADVMQIVIPLQEWVDLNPNPKGFDVADLLDRMPGRAREARELMESLAESIEGPEEPPEAEEPPPPPPGNEDGGPQPRWVEKPITNSKGKIEWVIDTRDENNIWVQITELDPPKGYRGRFSRDVFTHEVLLDGKPLPDGLGPHVISHEISRTRLLRAVTPDKVRARIGDAADLTKVNPLADELKALKWDGKHRYLLGYAGVDVQELSWGRVAGWRWLLGLVKRILEPGCIHDGVLVLEGPQGAQKTSFFRTVGSMLGRDLFVEVDKLTREPDTLMILQGKAVVELAEMTAHRRGDTNAVKSMLSTQSDKYRRPYGRKPEDVKRTCVFGGTTNDRKYLRDPTGNRRYWIVRVVREMRLDALAEELPQLLAQAVHYLTHPEPPYSQNWLTPDEERMQEAIAKERLIEWPQFDGLDRWLDGLGQDAEIERDEVWKQLGYTTFPPNNGELAQQLALLMEERGWEYKQRHSNGRRRSWKRPPLDPEG